MNNMIYNINNHDNIELAFKKISEGVSFIIGRLYRYVTLILGFKPKADYKYSIQF